jgi:hypothetical protein
VQPRTVARNQCSPLRSFETAAIKRNYRACLELISRHVAPPPKVPRFQGSKIVSSPAMATITDLFTAAQNKLHMTAHHPAPHSRVFASPTESSQTPGKGRLHMQASRSRGACRPLSVQGLQMCVACTQPSHRHGRCSCALLLLIMPERGTFSNFEGYRWPRFHCRGLTVSQPWPSSHQPRTVRQV